MPAGIIASSSCRPADTCRCRPPKNSSPWPGPGAVIFEDDFPADVPGWGNLEKQRAEYKNAMVNLERRHPASPLEQTKIGRGQIFVGRVGMALSLGSAVRER